MLHDRSINYSYNDNHITYIILLNQHVVQLKFTQCCMSNIFQ